MREIIFRGKRIDNGEWVYGDLLSIPKKNRMSIFGQEPADINYPVLPETVGQYTGLKDKNGKEIYEGDVVRTHFSFGHEVTQEPFVIMWNKERAMFEGSKPKPLENDYLVTFSFFPEQRFLYEIIGNIHESEVQK